jgi:predicted transcriptional regulator YheO
MAQIRRTITNLDQAFEIIVAEARDRFDGKELRHLNKDQKTEAVLLMRDLGVLNLREAINKVARELDRSRVWVYNVIKADEFMLDLSRTEREEQTQ